MIEDWKVELHKYGFEYKTYAPSEKAFVKYVGNIEQQIWEDSIRQQPGEIVVNACISILDPFCIDDKCVVVLNGRLGTDGVIIPRSDTGVGRFWRKEESSEALELLIKLGLPWFEENSSLESLIEYIKNDVITRPKTTKEGSSCSWFFKELLLSKFQSKKEEVEIRTKPINHLILSLLYYHTGRHDLSCLNAKEWLKRCPNLPDEPDRTLRQLREMGCPEDSN